MQRLSSKISARFHLIVALRARPMAEDVAWRVALEEGDARNVPILHDFEDDVLITVAERRPEQIWAVRWRWAMENLEDKLFNKNVARNH